MLMRRLVETGENERLTALLRAKLLSCGWNDEIKELCKDSIQSKSGLEVVTVEELVADILPYGKALVPEEVKSCVLDELQQFIGHDEVLCNIQNNDWNVSGCSNSRSGATSNAS